MYDESLPYSMLPTDLAQLAARLAEAAVTKGEFKAEAAIVNYYGPGKTFKNALYCYTIRNLLGWF